MFFKVSDSNSRALIEVSVTVHPSVIRDILIGRDGAFMGLLRMIGFLALAYLSIGFEVTSGKYFGEIGFHPAVLLLAYAAIGGSVGVAMLLAILCGILLDAGFAAPLGVHALLLALSTGGVAALFAADGKERAVRPWTSYALCGACANGIFTLGCMLIHGNFNEFPMTVLLSTALAAMAYMPVIAFLLDMVNRRANIQWQAI